MFCSPSKYAFIMAWEASLAFLILRFRCFVSGRSGRRRAHFSPFTRASHPVWYISIPLPPCPRPTHLFLTAAPWSCMGCVMCTQGVRSRPSHLPEEGPRGEINAGPGMDLVEVYPRNEGVPIPWTEEPGRLRPMGSRRVGHDWATSLSLFTFMHWRRKWQPTPVFLPGESQGRGSLVGCCLWGRTEWDTTEAT